MTYQRARGLKNKGLGSLIVDRIVSGEGVGRSIRTSISDKTVAKFTRIKEKFDPLNIGKAVGGRLGAYALGRLTGRSNEDISYFTGTRIKARQVQAKMNPLVTKVSEGDRRKMKKGDGLADVMSKIYNLIKANMEEQKEQHEVQHNLNIDKEKQREKWHSELIKALTGTGGKTTTATPEKKEGGGGLFDGIMDFIKSMIEKSIKGVMDVINNLKTLVQPALDFFKAIGKLVSPLLEFIGSKFFAFLTSSVGLLGVTTIGSLAALLFLGKAEKEKIEDNPNAPEYKDNPYAMSLRGEAKNIGQATAQNQRKATKQIPRKQVEDFVNSDFTDKELMTELGGDRKTLKKWLVDNPKPGAMYQAPVAAIAGQPNTSVPAGGVPQKTDKAAIVPAAPAASSPPATSGGSESPVPTAIPMPPAPADTGSRVQTAINQNIDMNLDQDTSKTVFIDNSKSVNAGGGSSAPAVTMDSSVTVRTDDPTLQNIFKKLVRPV